MKIFLTGAGGYVGSVLTEHLRGAGHEVAGLARSGSSAAKVEACGGTAVRGSLADLDVLRAAANDADAVIHATVDFADPDQDATERRALAALLEGLDGSRPLIYTSTGLVYAATGSRPAHEQDPVDEHTFQPHKVAGERQVLDNGVVPAHVIRAGLVYGRNGPGLVQDLRTAATESGRAYFINEGANRISAVHVDDLADLYVRLLAQRPAGAVFNAAGPEPVSMREIADAVARNTETIACSLTMEEAQEKLEPQNTFALSLENVLDPSLALHTLGWKALSPTLVDDVTDGSYHVGP